jgi:hypothetical protein
MRVQQKTGSFALCVEDSGMEELEARRVYQVLPDREARLRPSHAQTVELPQQHGDAVPTSER